MTRAWGKGPTADVKSSHGQFNPTKSQVKSTTWFYVFFVPSSLSYDFVCKGKFWRLMQFCGNSKTGKAVQGCLVYQQIVIVTIPN